MRSVTVRASKEYPVFIGPGLLDGSGERVRDTCGGSAAAIVADDAVYKLYGGRAGRSLTAAGYKTVKFVFPHGEQSKTMETYASLLNFLSEANLTRTDVVVALGGGVTGDMAGFAAATYLRGVKLAQLPTTLLAMVDSSVGGKTAVNLPSGKNQAGTFYQPDIVLCDTGTLDTLPEEVYRDGCAEMVKHGMIASAELFGLLKEPLEGSMEALIARNVTIKRDIVAQDERDNGVRQLLNFGHTIAHGIEKHSGYTVPHGNAVAAGMAISSRGAWRMGFCDEECHLGLVEMLKRFGLPYETGIPPETLLEAALSDKKRSGSRITEVLPEKIGKCVLHSFSLDELGRFIRLGMGG
jgi:3-dehydroquinate synthase